MKLHPLALLAAATLGFLPCQSVLMHAQSKPAAGAADDVVTLDVFEVRSRSDDNPYMQTETTTGTRVPTMINDLPFQVASITSEFLEDFDLFDPNGGDLSNMVSSLSDVTIEGNYSMRGFSSTYSLRDGFYRLGLNDRASLDRVDVIKGPAAAMYGQTVPSGIVNYISRRPKAKPYGKLIVAAGTNDFARGEISLNTPVNSSKSVLNLFAASLSQAASYANPYGFTKTATLFDTLEWKITPGTILTVRAEYNKRSATSSQADTIFNTNAQDPNIPYTNATIGTLDTLNRRASTFSQRGPGTFQKRDQSVFSVMLQHNFSRAISARIAGYFYYRDARQLGTNTTGTTYVDNNGNPRITRGAASNSPATSGGVATPDLGSEYYSWLIENGGAVQSDLTARYKLFGGTANAVTVLMLDFNTNRRRRKQLAMSADHYADIMVEHPEFTGRYVYLDDPDYLYFRPSVDDYSSVNRNDDTSYDDFGGFLRQQIFFLDNRLRTFAGVRFDYMQFDRTYGDQFRQSGDGNTVYNQYSSSANRTGDKKKYTETQYVHAWSPYAGVNYQYTENIAFYGSYSQSFTPNAQNTNMGDRNLPNELGEGWDYGIKANLFKQRLWATLGGFYVVRDGVKVLGSVAAAHSEDPDYTAGGMHVAKGVEMDLNWIVSSNIQMVGTYGHVRTEVVKNPSTVTDLIGRPTQAIPKDNGSLSIRYKFPDPLAGLSLAFRLSYTGRAQPYSNNSSAANTALRDWVTPSYTTINLGVAYNFKIKGIKKIKHTLRATVKNMGDREFIDKKGTYQGAGRTFQFSYTSDF
ncbi:MAG: TonB-dependent receptor [Opitutaceae bacterium]|jgi:outer membrane receptor protein involved in Fe transport|nr:TonB-dependent receptor [Opitutaceae bacterium]